MSSNYHFQICKETQNAAIWVTIGTLGARVGARKILGVQIHSEKENAAICVMIKALGIRMDAQKVLEKAA